MLSTYSVRRREQSIDLPLPATVRFERYRRQIEEILYWDTIAIIETHMKIHAVCLKLIVNAYYQGTLDRERFSNDVRARDSVSRVIFNFSDYQTERRNCSGSFFFTVL